MRRNLLLWLCSVGIALAQAPVKAPAPEPPRPPLAAGQVHSVYLLGMAYGLDQHLAQYLVRLGIYQVTTDPQTADAVLTDSLGPGFEVKLRQLYPPPAAAAPETPPEEEDPEAKVKREEKERAKEEAQWNATRSTWGRGRGNVYLVDRYSKTVIYTMYAPPKDSSRPEVDKAAKKIAEDLLKRIKPKS